MNSFTFVDVTPKGKQPTNARKQVESKTDRKIIAKYRFQKSKPKELQ